MVLELTLIILGERFTRWIWF